MSVKTLMFLTSALATAGLVIEPLAANADGMSQLGTWGKPAGMGAAVSNLTCDGVPGIGNMNIRQMNLPHTPGVGGMSAFRPSIGTGINPNLGGNVSGNIGFNKSLNVMSHDGAVLNVESGAPAGDGGSRRNFDGNRGSFSGRQLNVVGGGDAVSTSQPLNVETGSTQRNFGGGNRQLGADQPISTYGHDASGAGSTHVSNSRLFGGGSGYA